MNQALQMLQPATPADEIGSITGHIVDYVKLLLVLGAILILAYLTIRFWMPRMAGVKGLYAGPISVAARFPLESKKSLYVVKVGAEFFLIGTSEQQIQLLASLDADKVEPFLVRNPRAETAGEFSRLLKKLRRSQEH